MVRVINRMVKSIFRTLQVRKDVSWLWVARWMHSRELVRPSDQAVAYRRMQLELIAPPSDSIDVSALYIFASD